MKQPSFSNIDSQSVNGNGNEIGFPKTLKCSPYKREDMDSESTSMIKSSCINRILRRRRNNRQIRYANTYPLLYLIRKLPRQNTNNPFAKQIFSGSSFH
ncbi:unnamed protein product [Rhizophagus irregularis]|uniref:Uncharacterized protein n=1 Tax=Rhizophagus irregularis TaxID=588596 RepID=A0A2N1MW17_9GLOM|nr:hypothetical protein RhiirC2_785610 [Rhizophagus irregularis]CAB4396211.1 unnamed protein product [Rhizophagus irregularis]